MIAWRDLKLGGMPLELKVLFSRFPEVRRIINHKCGDRNIVSSDDPINRTIGFACFGCGEGVRLPITVLKERNADVGRFKVNISKRLATPEGRSMLASQMNAMRG